MTETGSTLPERLAAIQASGTPVERAIATYLIEHTQELPFETAASLAEKIRVSEVSIGRFARSLGYRNLKEVKSALKADADTVRISAALDSPWLRGDALAARFALEDAGAEANLQLDREVQAVIRNHALSKTPEFSACVKRLAHIGAVRIAGFQTERGMAQYFAHNLIYLRPNVVALDMNSGHFADVFLDDPENTALVIIETRRYSQLAHDLAKKAHAEGIALTIITDSYCAWAGEYAAEVFRIDTDFAHFWDATGQIASLINLLVNRIFAELGPSIESRMNRISANYAELVGHQR